MKKELTYDTVRKVFDPSTFEINSPEVSSPDEKIIIGQERAVNALQFGLGIKADGFNIYASGIHGTGKLAAVKSFIEEPARKQPVPDDYCYVNNFKDPYQPTKLKLPHGQAAELSTDIKNFIHDARQALIRAFEHEDFVKRSNSITGTLQQQQEDLFKKVNGRAEKESILIQGTPVDITTVPLKDGEPMSDEDFGNLTEAEQDVIREKQKKFILYPD